MVGREERGHGHGESVCHVLQKRARTEMGQQERRVHAWERKNERGS